MNTFLSVDIAIIGSGSAAFACAIKASERGARVILIEGADVIGGCCVNLGCVPSKMLIRAAQHAWYQEHAPFAGMKQYTPVINRRLLAEQQRYLVEELRSAKYQAILENNPAITLIKGWATFKEANILSVCRSDDPADIEIQAAKILIATGSRVFIPEIEGLNKTPFWTSDEALFTHDIPENLIVLGSSSVALELAQAFHRLGSKVTILARGSLLSGDDPKLGEALQVCLENEGIHVRTNTLVTRVDYHAPAVILHTISGTLKCDRLLLCTGRSANIAQLGLDKIGVKTNHHGEIIVNQSMQTSVPDIYAAGDCTNLPKYVYVAASAGSRAAINMTGGDSVLDLSILPVVIFTSPQVARVGLSEQQAQAQGILTDSRVLALHNVPRARVNFETEGFIKLVVDKNSGRLIGAQILANEAGEIIQTVALAIRNHMTVSELAEQIFPYLTMVEGLKLCAQSFSLDLNELSCCAS